MGRRLLREAAAMVGLALIIASAFFYDADTPFPALAALPPCLGAAMIIGANGASLTAAGRLLATRPLVFVGLISYSLYLWHWPLFAFGKYRLGELGWDLRAVLVVLAFALAAVSWRWVETPFRRRQVCPSRKSVFAFAGAGLASLLVAGVIMFGSGGVPQRFSPDVTRLFAAKSDRAFITNLSTRDVTQGKFVKLGDVNRNGPVRILIWGDSHAMAAAPAFDALCKERGISGRSAQHSVVAPLLGYYQNLSGGMKRSSLEFNEAVFSYIRANRVADVVLIARWGFYPAVGGAEDSSDFEPALLETIRRLREAGARPWVFLQVPAHSFDVPRALARAAAFDEQIPPRAKPGSWNGISGDDPAVLERIVAAGGAIIDPRPRFLDPNGHSYVVRDDDTVLYCDAHHLTAAGAKRVLLPLLRETFPADAGGPGESTQTD